MLLGLGPLASELYVVMARVVIMYKPAFLLGPALVIHIYACVACYDMASGLRSPVTWLGLMARRVMGMAWPLWPVCYWRWLGPCYGPAFHYVARPCMACIFI